MKVVYGLGVSSDDSGQSYNTQRAKGAGGQIPLSLIGGFGVKNAPLPYVHPIKVESTGGIISVDMVRIELKFPTKERGEELAKFSPLLPSTELGGYTSYTAPLLPGRYRVLSTYAMGESAVVLGIGLVTGSSRVDMAKGFVEFNPNKAAQPEVEDVFHRWCADVQRYVKRSGLIRWDLAYDLPISREGLRLEKDRRKYKLELSKSLTEYLGIRNSGGYVKLYDKAAELGLDGMDITRMELTCEGSWGIDAIAHPRLP